MNLAFATTEKHILCIDWDSQNIRNAVTLRKFYIVVAHTGHTGFVVFVVPS